MPPGVQGYDRYAYVNNDPVKYTDPSGHCPMCIGAAVGALIGAAVGTIMVVAYNANSGHEMSIGDATLVIGTMALAGGLIGSGIGAAAGGQLLASLAGTVTVGEAAIGGISVGAGVGSYAAGNVASSTMSGNKFDPTSFAVSSATGAVQGGINAVAPKPIRLAGGAITGASQYIANEYFHGNSRIDPWEADKAMAVGFTTQFIGEALTPGGAGRFVTSKTLPLVSTSRIIYQETILSTFDFVKSSIINTFSSKQSKIQAK